MPLHHESVVFLVHGTVLVPVVSVVHHHGML